MANHPCQCVVCGQVVWSVHKRRKTCGMVCRQRKRRGSRVKHVPPSSARGR